MIKIILKFIKKYKWIFTIGSFIIAVSTFLIKEETRNFIWNQGWLFPFLLTFVFNMLLIVFLVYKLKRISESDIEMYNAAMSLLNYDNVDFYLEEFDFGGPFEWTEMERFYDFNHYCFRTKFQIQNKNLRKFMILFRDSLNIFLNRIGIYTCCLDNSTEFYKIPNELELRDRREWERQRKELNDLATKAHTNFVSLVKYAKEMGVDKSK
jgi:hypothetical protein